MKPHGKGAGTSILGGLNDVNAWKQRIESQTFAPPRIREFKPLKGYVLPRAEERARYAALPSQYV